MASITPHPGQRTRDRIVYGDPLKGETVEVAATFAGVVEIDDGASGFRITLLPEKAKAFGQALVKAAHWAADSKERG